MACRSACASQAPAMRCVCVCCACLLLLPVALVVPMTTAATALLIVAAAAVPSFPFSTRPLAGTQHPNAPHAPVRRAVRRRCGRACQGLLGQVRARRHPERHTQRQGCGDYGIHRARVHCAPSHADTSRVPHPPRRANKANPARTSSASSPRQLHALSRSAHHARAVPRGRDHVCAGQGVGARGGAGQTRD